MPERFYNICYICFVLLLGSGCGGCQQSQSGQMPEYDPPLEQHLSYWNLPIIIEVDQIEQKVNERVRGTIYVDNSYKNNNGDNIKLRIRKLDRIRVAVEANRILWEVPLRVYFDGIVEKKLGTVVVQSHQNTDFSAKLHFESQVAISRDWKLQTETVLKDVVWIKKPRIKLAFLNLTVGRAVEKVVKEKEDELLPRLDEVIAKHVNIRKPVGKAWRDIQKPILINKKIHPVWLLARPQSLEIGAIEGRSGRIYIHSRIGLLLKTQTGARPQVMRISPLPEARQVSYLKFPNNFDLHVLSEIHYEHINQLLADSLENRDFLVEGHRIRIEQALVRGKGHQLDLKVSISGDTRGDIHFMGVPHYNPEKAALEIRYFDFDLQSSQTLHQAADWLFHDAFRIAIQKRLVIPLEDHIDRVPELIQQAVANKKVGEKISVNIHQMDLTSTQVAIRPKVLQIQVRIQGNAGIALEKL
ncbi:MAG: DUF4403 family protein [Bacteroidetes bacterium]|nr:MAG: DUF4403 family protein [Bacteroidota bacterium]